MIRALLVIAAGGAAALGATAHAQSKTYPPRPVDKDRLDEQRSKTWDSAIHPERGTYRDLLAKARVALDERTPDQAKVAIEEMTAAIAAVPDHPEAYRLRGEGYLALRDWARCADDLQAAADRAARSTRPDDVARGATQRRLGLCQARAGRLAAAEHTLAQAASSGTRDAELWMRLGETRIAMGKLDEAIEALKAASDTADPGTQPLIQWLLAAAYDRAREPTDAAEAIRRAAGADRTFSTIVNPVFPLLGAGETEYLLGLAYTAEPARPEYSLVYFRRFVALAKDSPWRKRAEEHVRDLQLAELPDAVEKRGAAPIEAEALRRVVAKGMPGLRACLAHHEGLVLEVKATKVGPRTPEHAKDRPHLWAPPAGLQVTPQTDLEGTLRKDLDDVLHCVEPLVGKLPLPDVKERDAWYVAVFLVVAT